MASSSSSLPGQQSYVNPERVTSQKYEQIRRLSDESPDDSPWDQHKSYSQDVMCMMSNGDEWQQKKSETMEWCGSRLTFAMLGGNVHKLRNARFCRVRLCPNCQWRRSLAWKRRWHLAWPEIEKVAPKARYFHLVLTVPNVPVEELRETILKMSKAWKKMTDRKTWPALGFVRATEVTIAEQKGYVHPHFHVLMMVPPSYFHHGYMSAETWRDWWAKGLDKVPDELIKPYIRSIDPKQGLEGQAKAVMEIFKYAVKFETKKAKRVDGFWRQTFLELDRQIKGTQATSLGGLLREVFRGKEEISEEEMLGLDQTAEEVEEFRQYIYRFDLRFFVFSKKLDQDEVQSIENAEARRKERKCATSKPLPESVRVSEDKRMDWELNKACLKSMANDVLSVDAKKSRERKKQKKLDASKGEAAVFVKIGLI